jgi:hypothetical protein
VSEYLTDVPLGDGDERGEDPCELLSVGICIAVAR